VVEDCRTGDRDRHIKKASAYFASLHKESIGSSTNIKNTRGEVGEILWGINERILHTWHERLSERKAKKDDFDRLVREIFESGRGAYGAERICGIIRKRGFHAGYKKAKRSMNEQNLFSVHLRYQRCLTDSRKSRSEGFSNLLKKAVITEPFQTLSGDITYIPTDEGFEYTYTKTGMILAGMTTDRIKKGLILATLSSK